MKISAKLRQYGAASSREDRAFPVTVINAMMQGQPVSMKEIETLLDTVARRHDALEAVGLAQPEIGPTVDESTLQDERIRVVIKAVAENTLRRFDVLEEFRDELARFISFLDDRFVGKKAIASADDGLVFELEDGSFIPPAKLSSGEQHMFVLAYELLFETAGKLLLIDEPEISLHVGWQRSFVDDIVAMGTPRRIQFLLATHSPTLIGGRNEDRTSLDVQ